MAQGHVSLQLIPCIRWGNFHHRWTSLFVVPDVKNLKFAKATLAFQTHVFRFLSPDSHGLGLTAFLMQIVHCRAYLAK